MAEQTATINARIPAKARDALEQIARERRMTTGDDVRLADLVREALDTYLNNPVTARSDEFGTLVLDTLELLADEAERQGVEDAQDMAITLAPTAEQDPRTERLRAFVKKLHGTLQSV